MIVTDEWEGTALEASQNDEVAETGPIIYIRHPQWTSENQRQDIPVMIFTLAQYNYAFMTGYEEVEDILETNPLQPIESNNLDN